VSRALPNRRELLAAGGAALAGLAVPGGIALGMAPGDPATI
jgi:hypothetical protein